MQHAYNQVLYLLDACGYFGFMHFHCTASAALVLIAESLVGDLITNNLIKEKTVLHHCPER